MLMRRYYPVITRNTFEPSDIMSNLEQARKQLYRMFEDGSETEKPAKFPIELTETPESYQLKALIPGVEGEKIDINATEDTLTLNVNRETELSNSTSRPENEPDKNTSEQTPNPIVHIREFKYGQMERTIQFAQPIANDQIEARFKNGILTLDIPKVNTQKKRPVKISIS